MTAERFLKTYRCASLKNTTTAIVGPSGGGKTTLCNLIARFYDVQGGSITIGGHNVKEFTCDSLLKNISMVFQNVYLFNDTVRNNIRFGKSDATDEEVIDAAKKACCYDFIMALPNGFDTRDRRGRFIPFWRGEAENFYCQSNIKGCSHYHP